MVKSVVLECEECGDRFLSTGEAKCIMCTSHPGLVKVKTVFRFPNGMVAVTDEHGQQISHLQGKFEDVKEKVEAAADEQTEWNGWEDPKPISVTQAKKLSDEQYKKSLADADELDNMMEGDK